MLKRSIPIMTINNSSLVKNKQFKPYKYLGDPINSLKIFNEKGVDELIILDISQNTIKPEFQFIQTLANEAFMPIAYGGGINSIEQMRILLRMGIEKVSLNTAAFLNPGLITEAAELFGSQSIVCSIDYKKNILGKNTAYINNGQTSTKEDPLQLAKKYESLGAGEILLTSIDRECTRTGYDVKILEQMTKQIKIPIIVNGGASCKQDLEFAIEKYGASGSAAGSLFSLHGKHDAVLISYINLND